MSVPRIAIVGRPNVGKSTLFNRLSGSRIAITDHTPGVTRDSVESSVRIGSHACLLVDTGGYVEGNEGFDRLVRERSLTEAGRADLIMFLLDVTELTPEDEEVADVLRRYSDRVIVVVNKVDSSKRELLLPEFYALGFPLVVAISAAHGLGVDELRETVSEQLESHGHTGAETVDEPQLSTPGSGPVRITILGKPNTGKSTLTNRLLGEDRSIVSSIAGTTRDIVAGTFVFKKRSFTVMDTAGIRRKRSVSDSVEYYSVNRAVQAAEECDVAVLVIDAEEGLAEQEKKIAQVIIRRGKSLVIALNKWDIIKDVPNMLQAVQDRIAFVFPILS
ncbi:MAG: ribosome biogenesis GTPase Der, partial [Spirochaetota bacterium]